MILEMFVDYNNPSHIALLREIGAYNHVLQRIKVRYVCGSNNLAHLHFYVFKMELEDNNQHAESDTSKGKEKESNESEVVIAKKFVVCFFLVYALLFDPTHFLCQRGLLEGLLSLAVEIISGLANGTETTTGQLIYTILELGFDSSLSKIIRGTTKFSPTIISFGKCKNIPLCTSKFTYVLKR